MATSDAEARALFGGMGSVNVEGSRHPWFEPGWFDLEIDTLKLIDSIEKGLMFIGEFRVHESNVAGAAGNMRSWIQKLGTTLEKQMGMGTIKQLFFAAIGADFFDDAWRAYVDAPERALIWGPGMYSSANPCAGARVTLDAVLEAKKKSVGNWTRHNWHIHPNGATTTIDKVLALCANAPAASLQRSGPAAPVPGYGPQGYGQPNPYGAPAPAYGLYNPGAVSAAPAPQLAPDGRYYYWNGATWVPTGR